MSICVWGNVEKIYAKRIIVLNIVRNIMRKLNHDKKNDRTLASATKDLNAAAKCRCHGGRIRCCLSRGSAAGPVRAKSVGLEWRYTSDHDRTSAPERSARQKTEAYGFCPNSASDFCSLPYRL
ncbi:hypothetical protein SKAU_G00148400 [Synaphobranchus kaupii]|uniref:Uncharacterized protein n=1 Tax=Synaphobranchus kaupii TaxID=118154 RepID=A0A9Q1FU19_SYNKA|nr:hypothetical protein SKAU_G00148400 [Synaphobranchus kaupii]